MFPNLTTPVSDLETCINKQPHNILKYAECAYFESLFLSFLEFDINGSVEACMGLLNDIYEDGVKWHDIACYHTKVKPISIPL